LAAWASGLTGSENTRKVTISAIKALFTFAQKIGYIRVNPAVMIEAPKAKDELAAPILTEQEVLSMIYKTDKQRVTSYCVYCTLLLGALVRFAG